VSVSAPSPDQPSNPSTVVLPPGVTVGAGRETTQANPQGLIVQGMTYPVTLPSGTTTSVFVPYADVENIPKVQAIFDGRINALSAIPGQA
jgi:hypothetical protein